MMARDMIGKGTQCMEIEKPMGRGEDASFFFFRGGGGEKYIHCYYSVKTT